MTGFHTISASFSRSPSAVQTCSRAAGTFPPSLPSAVGTGFEIELGTPSQIRGERAPGSFGEEVERFSAWHRRRVTALPSMPPPAGGRGGGAAGGTARGVRESSRASDRGGFVSDAARASEVEKENAARAHVGGKRRRVPGLHHDLIVEDAPDGFPLSQVDDETGEARTVVSWKSVSPRTSAAPSDEPDLLAKNEPSTSASTLLTLHLKLAMSFRFFHWS